MTGLIDGISVRMYDTKLKFEIKIIIIIKIIIFFFASGTKLYRRTKRACYMAHVGERRGMCLVLAGKF